MCFNRSFFVLALLFVLAAGCSGSKSQDQWLGVIRDEAGKTGATTSDDKLDKHMTLIKAALEPHLKKANEEQIKAIGDAYTTFLLEEFNDVYNFRTIAPAQSAKFQISVKAAIELFRDADSGWGDRTFNQLIPGEERFAEWIPKETTHFDKAINWLEGLRQTKVTLLDASGAAVSNESLTLLLKRYVALTFDCHGEKNQSEIASALFGNWADDMDLVRAEVNERMLSSESSVAEEIYTKFGQLLQLDKPLAAVVNELQRGAQNGDLDSLFSASEEYQKRSKSLGRDPETKLTDVFKVALEKPLAKLDQNPAEIKAVFETAKRLDSKLVENLSEQLTAGVNDKLDLVLSSGNVERIRTFIKAANQLDISERNLVQDFLPKLAFGDSPDQVAKTISFLNAMTPGQARARLLIDMLGQDRLDESRLESLVNIDLQNDEVQELLPFIRQLPIDKDGRYTSDGTLKIAAKLPPGELRGALIETALTGVSLELKHLDAVSSSELAELEVTAICKVLDAVDFKSSPSNFATADVIACCGRIKNDQLRSAIITKMASSDSLTFEEIDQLIELNPMAPAIAALSVAGTDAITMASSSGKSISDIRRFYEKNMKLLGLKSTAEIAQACFDDALLNQQLPVIERHIEQLLQHEECKTAENGNRLWFFLKGKLAEVTRKEDRWDNTLVFLINTAGQIHAETKAAIGSELLAMIEASELDDKALLKMCHEVSRTESCTNPEIVQVIIRQFGMDKPLANPDLNSVRAIRVQLGLIVTQYKSDEPSMQLVQHVFGDYRNSLKVLLGLESISHDDLVNVFEMASEKEFGDETLKLPLATRILSLSDLESSRQNKADVTRYLPLLPEKFEHTAVCLQRLFRHAINEENWLDAESYVTLLKGKQALSEDETKLFAGLNEAIFAAKLAGKWKGRMIPFTAIKFESGNKQQIKQSLFIKSISGNRLSGHVREQANNDVSEFSGTIGLDGLTIEFNKPANNSMPDSRVTFSSRSKLTDLRDFDFGGLDKECEILVHKGAAYDFYLADIPESIEMLYSQLQEERTWGWFEPYVNKESKYLFHHCYRPGGESMQFDISDLTRNSDIEVVGTAYLHGSRHQGSGEIQVTLDGRPSPTTIINVPFNIPNDPFTELPFGSKPFSIRVPKGSRSLVLGGQNSASSYMLVSGVRAKLQSAKAISKAGELKIGAGTADSNVFRLKGKIVQQGNVYDAVLDLVIDANKISGSQTFTSGTETFTLSLEGKLENGNFSAKVFKGREYWSDWTGKFDQRTGILSGAFTPVSPHADPSKGTMEFRVVAGSSK